MNIVLKITLIMQCFITVNAKDLIFQKILFNRDNTEISGLSFYNNNLLFVADKLSNRSIYRVIFEGNRFYYKDHINLTNLKGHDSYFKEVMLNTGRPHKLLSPFDFEGITFCDNHFYLVNEQAREVLKINNQSLKKIKLDFAPTFKKFGKELKEVSTNAGFEGITSDCDNKKLYIAQERSPRGIIEVDLKTNKVSPMFATPLLDKNKLSPDYADIFYEKGHLYLLERNSRLISKYDVKKKKVVDHYFYKKMNDFNIDDLYKTGEPYGIAEGLAMTKDLIYLGLDNNKTKLSRKARKKFGLKGKFSSILIYKRPKGF